MARRRRRGRDGATWRTRRKKDLLTPCKVRGQLQWCVWPSKLVCFFQCDSVLCSEEQNLPGPERHEMPDSESSSRFQTCCTPTPRQVTSPVPVTTTLLPTADDEAHCLNCLRKICSPLSLMTFDVLSQQQLERLSRRAKKRKVTQRSMVPSNNGTDQGTTR